MFETVQVINKLLNHFKINLQTGKIGTNLFKLQSKINRS